MNKDYLKIALLIGLVAAIAAGLYLFKANNKTETQQEVEKQAEPMVKQTKVNEDQLPQGFPDDLPEEEGTRILQNYEATTVDGRLQSTRKMTTQRTLTQATNTYVNFFANLGWKKTNTSGSGDTNLATSMIKGTDTLVIVASVDKEKQNTISLTLTESVETEPAQTNE